MKGSIVTHVLIGIKQEHIWDVIIINKRCDMSLKDRWYMKKNEQGEYLQHNPKWCNCNACITYNVKLKLFDKEIRSNENETIKTS